MKSQVIRTLSTMLAMALVAVGAFAAFPSVALAGGNNKATEYNELLNYINDYRTSKGNQKLQINTDFTPISEEWTKELIAMESLDHNPDYAWDERIPEGWTSIGEIVGYTDYGTVTSIFDGWIKSAGHENILNEGAYNIASIGLERDKNGRLYGTVNFYSFEEIPANTFDKYPSKNVETPAPVVPNTPAPEKPADNTDAPIPGNSGGTDKPATPKEPVKDQPSKPAPVKPITPPKKPKQTFADVKTNNLFYKEIETLAGKKITRGWDMSNGTKQYRPLEDVKRDAMIAFIYRAMGSPAYTPPKKSPFSDVKTNNIFYKEIAWAHSEGIAEGWKMKNGTRQFRPLQPVKRDAVAAFLMRASGDKAPAAKKSFSDVKTNQPHAAAMTWMKDKGISKGWANGSKAPTYQPLSNTKRDAMAAFVVRWLEYTD